MRVCDSHTDILTKLSEQELEQYIKGNKRCIHTISTAVFTSEGSFGVEDVVKYSEIVDKLNKKLHTKCILSIEDLGFVDNSNDLDRIIRLKPISTTLTWNRANQYGGGADTKLGLTKLGREVVRLLEDNGILIDTAHLSRRAFWKLVRQTKYPIYNSHANIYSMHRHKRNLTDKQIQAIVDSGGYMGITLYRDFCVNKTRGEDFTAKDIALQFDYLIRHFGHHSFGFGTDLYGIDRDKLPKDIQCYADLKKVAQELYCLGYSKSVIKDLFYRNYIKFIKRIIVIQKSKEA